MLYNHTMLVLNNLCIAGLTISVLLLLGNPTNTLMWLCVGLSLIWATIFVAAIDWDASMKAQKKTVLRVWKLGDLDHRIVPGEATFARLEEILRSFKQDGTLEQDVLWGPDIQVTVTQFEHDPNAVDVIRAVQECDRCEEQ